MISTSFLIICLLTTIGPAPQPSTVIVSGVEYSDVLLFPAGTGALTPQSIQSFMITDDEVGLETLEQYQLSFVGASRIIAVILGAPTTISITDEDGENYCF